jgi:hypothetical protein
MSCNLLLVEDDPVSRRNIADFLRELARNLFGQSPFLHTECYHLWGCFTALPVIPEKSISAQQKDGLRSGLNPATEDFGNAPCLGNATARRERWFGVEDLADGTDACLIEMRDEILKQGVGSGAILRINL